MPIPCTSLSSECRTLGPSSGSDHSQPQMVGYSARGERHRSQPPPSRSTQMRPPTSRCLAHSAVAQVISSSLQASEEPQSCLYKLQRVRLRRRKVNRFQGRTALSRRKGLHGRARRELQDGTEPAQRSAWACKTCWLSVTERELQG